MKTIVITGASGGIGSALATELAAPGRRLLLAGRDAGKLEACATAARDRGAEAEVLAAAVEDPAFEAGLAAFDAKDPVDLLIVNAGVKTGNRQGIEDPVEMERIIQVNLTGAMRTVQAVLPAMTDRGRGQIALVGSLAARSPHADLLSYSATKAGIHAYAAALRRNLVGTGVDVSLIVPGFVKTPMTDRHLGPTPMALTPEQAARIIAKGLARRRPVIAFPRLLMMLVGLSRLLPIRLGDRIENGYRADIVPDPDEASRQKRSEAD